MEVLKKTMLQALTTGITQGYWNATTNVPDITPTLETGYMWYVSVSGNTLLGEINDWNVGDWVIKIDEWDNDDWGIKIDEWTNNELTNGGWGKVINNVSGSSGNTLIISNLTSIYHTKIGLKQIGHDLGFMDAYNE